MESTKKQARRLQTACDRCYRLKERCTRQSVTEICGRCHRVGLDCTTIRTPRQAGRKSQKSRHVLTMSDVDDDGGFGGSEPLSSQWDGISANSQPLDIGRWIRSLTDLNSNEKEKLLFLLDQPKNLDNYVVNPSFQDAERRSLTALFPAALPVLKDAYLASAGALKSTHHRRQDSVEMDDGSANFLHALAAMKTLRALPVSTPQDAALCLTLGVSLSLFIYSNIGHGVYQISQHCLSITKPFVEAEMLDSDAELWMTFLVLLEMMDCLVYRRRPTIRFPWRQSHGFQKNAIDRHLGLCAPLLPYFHDLCVVSHSLANTTDVSYMALVEKQLCQIQAKVEAWQPSQPDRFTEQFDSAEVIHLLAQARLYRLSALLVSHRLRYKFGKQDDQASVWANEIMNELELVRRVTQRASRCVTLPFVVAAIEMRDLAARKRTLRNADEFVDQFTPAVQKATKTFLARVWWERDNQITTSWFDSTHKPCVVLASLDTVLFGC